MSVTTTTQPNPATFNGHTMHRADVGPRAIAVAASPHANTVNSSALAVFIGLGGYAATMAAGVGMLAVIAAFMH